METTSTSHTRRWWGLVTVSITQLMVALDATVINIALPRAQADLNFSSANRQWLITAYALAFGSLMFLGGRLSDLWGRRTSLIVGLIGFSLASLTLAFREPKERAKAFAIFGAVGGSGAAIGLLLGGVLTQWASWRWCLYINLLFAGVALVGVALFVDSGKGEHRTRLDVLGTVLGSGGLFFVVYGFGHAVTARWSDESTWGSLLIGGVLLAFFVGWQRRSAHPLLPLRLLLNRTRGGSLVALFITSIGIFSISLFLAYYLQG